MSYHRCQALPETSVAPGTSSSSGYSGVPATSPPPASEASRRRKPDMADSPARPARAGRPGDELISVMIRLGSLTTPSEACASTVALPSLSVLRSRARPSSTVLPAMPSGQVKSIVAVRRTEPGRRAGADRTEPRGFRPTGTGIAMSTPSPHDVPLAEAGDRRVVVAELAQQRVRVLSQPAARVGLGRGAGEAVQRGRPAVLIEDRADRVDGVPGLVELVVLHPPLGVHLGDGDAAHVGGGQLRFPFVLGLGREDGLE